MTQEFKTVQREAITLDKHICDFCHKEIEQHGYEKDEGCIVFHTGGEYPEGNLIEEERVDMCHACYDSVVLPWLKSKGIEPQKIDDDTGILVLRV